MPLFDPAQAEFLNTCCACQTLNEAALTTQMTGVNEADLLANMKQTHPHLFAFERVFVSGRDLALMRQTIETIDAISGRAAYRQAVLEHATGPASSNPGTRGVFNSYDFHLTTEGPALIEINTNAGGAFLATAASAAHDECCTLRSEPDAPLPGEFARQVSAMFEAEWQLSGRTGRPRTIVIVDDDPESQFLYPDFVLARSSLRAQGFDVSISDAEELEFLDGRLTLDGDTVDLVYNRLTDFMLNEPQHGALRAAVDASAAVVTPHPFHHAMLADKRHLALLTDPEFWAKLGLSTNERDVLTHLPRAEIVSEVNAERLWADRKNQFFKPFSGHAGKGVYRGDKLTRATWANILEGGYIAQTRVIPSERRVLVDGEDMMLKTDIRAFTYGADIFLVSARLYQGQVTNMRTPSGGLAPVSIGCRVDSGTPTGRN